MIFCGAIPWTQSAGAGRLPVSSLTRAFPAVRHPCPDVGKRSIYAFCERSKGVKAFSNPRPQIRRIGPYVRSHRRHFRQQSDYTICAKFEQTWRFWDYESVFVPPAPQVIEQDVLWKFNFPSVQRVAVLQLLDEYNLNAFSLFDSEEALLETMWLRELVFRKN